MKMDNKIEEAFSKSGAKGNLTIVEKDKVIKIRISTKGKAETLAKFFKVLSQVFENASKSSS